MAKYNTGKNHPKFIELTNKRFGNLLCLDYIRHPKYLESNQRWVWECLCDCGNISYVRTSALTTKRTDKL